MYARGFSEGGGELFSSLLRVSTFFREGKRKRGGKSFFESSFHRFVPPFVPFICEFQPLSRDIARAWNDDTRRNCKRISKSAIRGRDERCIGVKRELIRNV